MIHQLRSLTLRGILCKGVPVVSRGCGMSVSSPFSSGCNGVYLRVDLFVSFPRKFISDVELVGSSSSCFLVTCFFGARWLGLWKLLLLKSPMLLDKAMGLGEFFRTLEAVFTFWIPVIWSTWPKIAAIIGKAPSMNVANFSPWRYKKHTTVRMSA